MSKTNEEYQMEEAAMREIVVIGGGFAGLSAALNAADEVADHPDIRVTLVSALPDLVIRPRLYERDPETLGVPLEPLLDKVGVRFILARAGGIDTEAGQVKLEGSGNGLGDVVAYDRLVIAVGSEIARPDIPGLETQAFDVDSQAGAVKLDNHLKNLRQTPETDSKNGFVIIGAGMTGIELACELRDRLEAHHGAGAGDDARITLVEQAGVVGPEFGDDPRPVIEDALNQAKVDIKTGRRVVRVEPEQVILDDGSTLPAQTVVVATGMRASGLTAQIDAERDMAGRLVATADLSVPGHDGIYAAGDAAQIQAENGHAAMMSCQHARTMGKYAGVNAARSLIGGLPRDYAQPGYTTCLDLGRSGAVFSTGWDRKVKATGDEAKKRKRWINTELIYPPEPGSRDEILAAMRIDDNGR